MITYFTQAPDVALILGLSSDTKPAAIPTMTFIETDTGKVFQEAAGEWVCSSDTTYQRVGAGYAINVQALSVNPADGQTIYFGMNPKAPITTAGTNKVHFRRAGTIKTAEIYSYAGTAGTAESWSLYIRKNGTTDTLVATVAAATSQRIFSNTELSIPVVAGDYIEMKLVNPTWATNPLATTFGGYLYVE